MLDLMRRYVHGFVNSHDPEVARQIMAPDYRLNMGTDTLVGRDEVYIPAVLHQVAQFPALGFAVHDLITDGTMTALLFSEHGRSAKQPESGAAWRGVSIYRVRDGLLAECWVEQDHFGRRHQLASAVADPVGTVALDPWSGHSPVSDDDRNAGREALDGWAAALTSWPAQDAVVDRGSASATQPLLDVTGVAVHACVVEGERLAFNATISGAYRGGLPGHDGRGQPVELYVGAFASIRRGPASAGPRLADIEAVTNRVAIQRQLRARG